MHCELPRHDQAVLLRREPVERDGRCEPMVLLACRCTRTGHAFYDPTARRHRARLPEAVYCLHCLAEHTLAAASLI
jgi:hypothetical protein